MARPSVAVRIAGHEYRIRSDANEEWLQRVARHVDDTMSNIRRRTATVDSFDVAVLAALNLARELLEQREGGDARDSEIQFEPKRLRTLIDLAESPLEAAP